MKEVLSIVTHFDPLARDAIFRLTSIGLSLNPATDEDVVLCGSHFQNLSPSGVS
jgi:hypothetical protein